VTRPRRRIEHGSPPLGDRPAAWLVTTGGHRLAAGGGPAGDRRISHRHHPAAEIEGPQPRSGGAGSPAASIVDSARTEADPRPTSVVVVPRRRRGSAPAAAGATSPESPSPTSRLSTSVEPQIRDRRDRVAAAALYRRGRQAGRRPAARLDREATCVSGHQRPVERNPMPTSLSHRAIGRACSKPAADVGGVGDRLTACAFVAAGLAFPLERAL